MKKTAKISGSSDGFRPVLSRKKRRCGILEDGSSGNIVGSKVQTSCSWGSETGDTTESDSIDMEKKCLVEKTSFDFGEGSAIAGDLNQTPTGSKVKTKKMLGKSLGKIDFSLSNNEDSVLLDALLELLLSLKNLVNIFVRKFFTLDIGLNKVVGKSSQEKLQVVRKLFSKINGFGGVSTPSKFVGIIRVMFTSELSLVQAFKKAEEAKIIVNSNLKKSSGCSDWAVVLKKISICTSTEAVHAALSEFGIIKSIKMQLVGLWQKAVVEFEQVKHADLVAVHWSILIGKDAVHIARSDVNKASWDACDVYKALLYTLPMGTNAHDIWDYVASIGEKTCVIDHYLVSYAQARCATVCFDSVESLDAVIETMLVLKGANLHWSHFVLAKCTGCEKLGHILLACPIGEKKSVFSGALLQKIFSDSNKTDWLPFMLNIWLQLLVLVDIVMSEGLGVATGGETVVGAVVFNLTVISRLEETLNNLLITVMSLLAKIDNTGLDDIICWHKEKNNLVSIFTESKLKKKMFTSGLESSYLGAGVVVVMNFSLARHVCKILEVPDQLLFSQAGNINSLIAKAVNKSSFIILRVNAVVGYGMFGVEEYFDTDYQAVSVLVGLGDGVKWAKFKDDMVANVAMLHNDFLVAGMHSNLNAMWVAFRKVLCLSAKAKSSKFHKLELLVSKLVKASHLDFFGKFTSLLDKWKSLDSVNASMVKFLFLLGSFFDAIQSVLSKVRKSYCSFKIFELNKDHTIRSVLECFFCKVTLDHLVMDNELVLEPNLIRTKVDVVIEGWTRKRNVVSVVPSVWHCQYQPLEYIFNNAFSDVMCPINFDEMSSVISNLPNGKVEAWMSIIPKPYEWKGVLMNTCLIALIEMACKILSKIFLDKISFVYNTTTQSPIFAIGSVIKNALKKNRELWLVLQDMQKAYDSVGWEHLKKSLVRIKMCDKFIRFFGGIHNVHDGLDQGEVFFPLLWCIFYDPLLCKVKKQESVCGYRLDFRFMTRTGCSESWTGLISFLTAGAFVDDTIWVGSSQATMQHILNVASEFFQINDISINNDKMVAIFINCRVSESCLLISSLSILIAKKGESHQYLGIFLSTKGLSKPSLAKAYLDVRFFTNLMLRKAVSDKQTQFSFVSINVCAKWDTMIHKSLKSKSGLPCDFSNDAIHHPSFKLASVVGFTNSVSILGCLFAHRLHNLQVLSWCPCHPLLFFFCININFSNNFLASIVWIFLGCNFSLSDLMINRYGIAFVKQLCSHTSSGPVLHWFDISVCYLNNSGLPFVCDPLLSCIGSFNILEFYEFEVVCDHLLRVDSGCLFLFMDGFLSGLGTLGIRAGAAAFFEDIDLGLGVEVSGLVSFTMVELQAIALALECVSLSHLIDLFSDSQAVLDVCKSEFLTHLDFRNCHSGVLKNECADAFTRTAVFSNMHLPYIINEHFLKAGGITVSDNSRHFVHNIFQSVYCAH
ncbi:hypothetical protein G9A89_012937 [Geosiphon pyriformis]|nr:hypothetical protein G9A89_012937 [Geosiphon pyriformis]